MLLRQFDTNKDDMDNNVYTDWDSDSLVILYLFLTCEFNTLVSYFIKYFQRLLWDILIYFWDIQLCSWDIWTCIWDVWLSLFDYWICLWDIWICLWDIGICCRHLDTDKDDIENNVYTDWDSDSPVILHLSLLWLIGLIFYKIFS